jgi:hypothetical protein
MNYTEIASTVIPILTGIGGAYLKLRDQITKLEIENKSAAETRIRIETEINIIQRDIHNLALMIGTKRALAEQQTQGE